MTMKDKTQLGKTLWAIADKLRGAKSTTRPDPNTCGAVSPEWRFFKGGDSR